MSISGVRSIGELAQQGALEFGDGYRTKRSERAVSGYRIIRVADVNGGAIQFESPDFVSQAFTRSIGGKAGRPGDILLTTKGTVGRVAIVPELHEPIVYSPQLCYFRVCDADVIDPRYLSFWFRSDEFVHQASHRMNNTDMAAYINLTDIRSLILRLPGLDEQRAIAEVLGAVDDKIAANTKLIALLESHMSLEYSGAIAEARQATRLEEVAHFHNRKRIPLSAPERDVRPGLVPYYGASGIFGNVDEALFDEPLVLVGEDGSVIKDDGTAVIQYIWGPSWVNNHAHVLTGAGISTELLYVAIQREQVTMLVTGAVQPKINMGNLKRLELTIPNAESLGKIEALVNAETASKRGLFEENRTLAATRDAILPQLMSGKLRVRDAETAVEAVV